MQPTAAQTIVRSPPNPPSHTNRHLPEAKFHHGDYIDHGRTELARLAAKAGQLLTESHAAADHIMPLVRQRCDQIGLRRFAKSANIDDGHLCRILSGQRQPTRYLLSRLRQAIAQDNSPNGTES